MNLTGQLHSDKHFDMEFVSEVQKQTGERTVRKKRNLTWQAITVKVESENSFYSSMDRRLHVLNLHTGISKAVCSETVAIVDVDRGRLHTQL